jgi:hypothetical protein
MQPSLRSSTNGRFSNTIANIAGEPGPARNNRDDNTVAVEITPETQLTIIVRRPGDIADG